MQGADDERREASFFAELKRRNVFRVAAAYVVIGWLLVQVIEVLADAFEAPGWVLKMIIGILAAGFLPVLAFSWIYELTPEGLKRESELDRSTAASGYTSRKLDLVTIAAVLVGIVFVTWTQVQGPSPALDDAGLEQSASSATNRSEPVSSSVSEGHVFDPEMRSTTRVAQASVAVLPFVNRSANEENQYFADGLTETLMHALAQERQLKVPARTSSFAFKGEETDVREIAQTLNVAHILEGSVQRVGERVRVTAQLVRAADGFQVWSDNFDHTLDDVFRIQDEIASDVRGALITSLLRGDARDTLHTVSTDDIEAYDLYLQALTVRVKGSFAALQEAERLLKRALVRDANFIEAMTELAVVLWSQAGAGVITNDEAVQRGQALLEQVLERRPDNVRARTLMHVMSTYTIYDSGRIAEGVTEMDKLLPLTEQAPSEPLPRIMLVNHYRQTNRMPEALDQLDVLLQLDPLNPRYYALLGQIKEVQAEWDDARRALQKSLELEPEQPRVHWLLARVARKSGDIASAVREFERAMEMDPEDHEIPVMLADIHYHYGLVETGDRYKAMTDAISPTSPAARKIELWRAVAIGNDRDAERIARAMITDNVDDRQLAWHNACVQVLRTASLRGDYADGVAFIDKHAPGFSEPRSDGVHPGALHCRDAALGTLKAAMPAAEFDEFLTEHRKFLLESARVNLDNEPYLKARLLAAEGKAGEATRVLLDEVFSQPESRFFYVADAFEWQPYLAELKDDRQIAAALQRYEMQWQRNRDSLRN